jgi:hypothetical protein
MAGITVTRSELERMKLSVGELVVPNVEKVRLEKKKMSAERQSSWPNTLEVKFVFGECSLETMCIITFAQKCAVGEAKEG